MEARKSKQRWLSVWNVLCGLISFSVSIFDRTLALSLDSDRFIEKTSVMPSPSMSAHRVSVFLMLTLLMFTIHRTKTFISFVYSLFFVDNPIPHMDMVSCQNTREEWGERSWKKCGKSIARWGRAENHLQRHWPVLGIKWLIERQRRTNKGKHSGFRLWRGKAELGFETWTPDMIYWINETKDGEKRNLQHTKRSARRNFIV